MKLSIELYKLELLFDELNNHFFDGELNSPVITIQLDAYAAGWCDGVIRRWRNRQGGRFAEIGVNPKLLCRPFSEVAEVMLHEMIHLFIFQNNLSDGSHDKTFKECSEAHGLIVTQAGKQSYKRTDLSATTAEWVKEKFPSEKFDIYMYGWEDGWKSRMDEAGKEYNGT